MAYQFLHYVLLVRILHFELQIFHDIFVEVYGSSLVFMHLLNYNLLVIHLELLPQL